MPAPFPTATEVNDWLYFMLKGVISPGTIARGGVRGFKRQTGWDEQRGKGTQGATLILKSAPPVKGSFTMQLIGPGGFYATGKPSTDFADWDYFVANVLSISPAQQKAEGLALYYPGLASIGLTTVVVEDYSPIQHIGKNLYQVEVSLIEWQQPPKASIVSQPSQTAPDIPEKDAPAPVDPRIAALEQQIALANQGNQNP